MKVTSAGTAATILFTTPLVFFSTCCYCCCCCRHCPRSCCSGYDSFFKLTWRLKIKNNNNLFCEITFAWRDGSAHARHEQAKKRFSCFFHPKTWQMRLPLTELKKKGVSNSVTRWLFFETLSIYKNENLPHGLQIFCKVDWEFCQILNKSSNIAIDL